MLQYTITPNHLSHQWFITFEFDHNNDAPQLIKLPNWTLGSYMIRDFSRHIVDIHATCNDQAVQLTQLTKNTWQTPAQSGHYRIDYTVYANDLSVRASYLDGERGFINGAAVFLFLPERVNEPCQVQFSDLPETWKVVTSLPTFGKSFYQNYYQAENYAQLTDNPIELGERIETLHFVANGIPHYISISGYYHSFDRQRLTEDIQRICQTTLNMFPSQAPFSEYLFLLHVGDDIYGGLEHTSSTALLADRNALPPLNMDEPTEAYVQLMGLFSHEYFHAWNVKSIKPLAFNPYQLDHEAYTEQLWAFEGITAYYDDLILVRSGVISPRTYLNILAGTLTRTTQRLGRHHQTLAQSSFTAWNKFYKPDENSPNAIISYYQQGSLVALCLDLLIRSQTPYSLDTIMQQLYYDWQQTGQPLPEGYWQQRAQEVTGLDLSEFFQIALHSTSPLPLVQYLRQAGGIELKFLPFNRNTKGKVVDEFPEITPAPDLGCCFSEEKGSAEIDVVYNGGSVENAGLMPKDKIIAIDGIACSDLLKQTATAVDDTHTVHFFRYGVLRQAELTVQAAPAHTAFLRVQNLELLEQWLMNTDRSAS